MTTYDDRYLRELARELDELRGYLGSVRVARCLAAGDQLSSSEAEQVRHREDQFFASEFPHLAQLADET